MEISEIKEVLKNHGVYSSVPSLSSYGDKMLTLSYQGFSNYYEMCIYTGYVIHEEMTFGEILDIEDGIDFVSFAIYETTQKRILLIDYAPLRDNNGKADN